MPTKVKKNRRELKRNISAVVEPSVEELQVILENFRELVKRGEFTDDHLWHYIRLFLGYRIPRRKVCLEHDTPFDFIRDGFFGRYKNGGAVAYANRGGGKTLGLAILHNCLLVLYPGWEQYHVGAVQFQSDKCYEYFIEFAGRPVFKGMYAKTLISEAITHPLHPEYPTSASKIGIASGTYAAVSGPHPNGLSFDEVEECKDWKIIQKSLGCSMTTWNYDKTMRFHAFSLYTSTRDEVGGMMDRVLAHAGKVGWKVYTWCIWDVVERCPEERMCYTCPQETQRRCDGRCKKVPSGGFYSIEDFINKSSSVSDEVWISQFLCETPPRTGLVYKSFNRKVHVEKMQTMFRDGDPIYVGIDPGYHDYVLIWWQTNKRDELIARRERRWHGFTDWEICAELNEWGLKYTNQSSPLWLPIISTMQMPVKFIMDTAAPDDLKTFVRKMGWTPIRGWKKADNEIKDILLVREMLKPTGRDLTGRPRLRYDPSCVSEGEEYLGVIEEMERLKFRSVRRDHNMSEEIRDKDNHGCDITKYVVKALYGKQLMRAIRKSGLFPDQDFKVGGKLTGLENF